MRQRYALAAGLIAWALAGCAGDAGGYNSELAKRLGEAATDFRSQITNSAEPPAAPQFTASQRQQAVAVLRGDLRGVTSGNVDELLTVQRQAVTASEHAMKSLEARERALRSAQVDLTDPDLEASAAVRRFVEAYNGLVERAAISAKDDQSDMKVAVRSNRDMARALEAIRRGIQFGQFGEVVPLLRRAAGSLAKLGRLQTARRERQPLRAVLDRAAEPLVCQANASAQVSDLVELLAKRYPDSVLSDILVRPDGG